MYYRARNEDDPKGKTRFFESYKDPMTGKKRVVSVILDRNTTQTRKTAQRILAEKIKQRIRESTAAPDTDMTFGELTERYLAERQRDGEIRANTYTSDVSNFKQCRQILGADVLTENMTARYVNDCLRNTGKPNGWINNKVSCLKRIFRWAFQSGYIHDQSLIYGLKTYVNKEPRTKLMDKYLEPDELETLLCAVKMPSWYHATLILALSGLRVGELIALDTSDIVYDDRTPRNGFLRITKTCSADRVVSHNTKTRASTRDVFIQPELEKALEDLRRWRTESFGNTNILVPDMRGNRITYKTFKEYLRRVSKKAIGREITPHVLRHTHTSLLAEKGVPLEVISRRLGHGDSEITKAVYMHVTKGIEDMDRALIRSVTLLK